MQQKWRESDCVVDRALAESIRGMNGSCIWLLLQWPQSLSLRQVLGKALTFSSILGHALALVLRRQWRGGVHSWKHRLEKEGAALLCLRERRFQWRTLCRGFLQVQCLLRNTSHLPPFLIFSLELTSAESWGKPSHQQQVFLSSQKPQRVLISFLTRDDSKICWTPVERPWIPQKIEQWQWQ